MLQRFKHVKLSQSELKDEMHQETASNQDVFCASHSISHSLLKLSEKDWKLIILVSTKCLKSV